MIYCNLLPKHIHLQQLHRTVSRQNVNYSKEGDSTNSLSSLFQCSATCIVKKFHLMLRWHFLSSSFCLLPLVLRYHYAVEQERPAKQQVQAPCNQKESKNSSGMWQRINHIFHEDRHEIGQHTEKCHPCIFRRNRPLEHPFQPCCTPSRCVHTCSKNIFQESASFPTATRPTTQGKSHISLEICHNQ